ncbi:MAG TPA: AAA family ATPase [Burkholderiales bacterium]|nr:AAA family ATPase [Burkholderiales bacterium]
MATRVTSDPQATPSLRLRFDTFELDEADARLMRAGEAVQLAPKPFAVLCALARAPGALVTKNALLDSVWGHRFVSESVLKSTISELRSALHDDPKQPRYIETVSRRGYRFIAAVSAPVASAGSAPAAVPWMIGRADALERLRAAWRLAADGRRQIVWIAGEAGVGKTTLIERFTSEVGDANCAHGQCVEQYGAGEPYLPMLEAIGALCRQDAAFAELLRAVAPTWLVQLPWLSTSAEREYLRQELSGAGQARMLREMAELLERYTENRPLVLVTEDLHWSDQATVQLMDYVARRRGTTRLLWLASFRITDIIASNHPVRAVRHELRLHALAEEIVLDAFSEQEVAQYVAARAPALAADEKFVRALHGHTDGLPLFIADVVNEVVARGSLSGSMAVPKGLSEIVERYIRQLAPEERTLLEAASVCGAEFRLETVARVLERDAASLAGSCAELVRQQRWLSDAEGGYAFRHAVYREVLYERIAALMRVELHRKVAEVLERERAEAPKVSAAELAFHFEQGRELRAALRYYAEAAESALLHFSPAEAMTFTERGLSQLSSVEASSARTDLEITLASLQGTAAVQAVGIASMEAKRAYQRAQSLLDAAPQHPLRGLFLHGLGFVLWLRGELDEARVLAERSHSLADQTGDPTVRLCACFVHGIVEHVRGRPRIARDWLEKALASAEGIDKSAPPALRAADPSVVILGLLALQLQHLGFVDQARARMREAHARARALRAPGPQAAALWFDAFIEVRMGNAERVADLAAQLLALIEEYAFLPHGRAAHHWFYGWAQARLGDPPAGYRLIHEGHEKAAPFNLRALVSEARAYGAEVLVRSGDWSAARRELDEAMQCADAIGERQYRTQLLLLDAEIAAGLGEPERARESVRQAVAEARAQQAPWLVLLALSAQCERADAGAEDLGALAQVVDQLTEGLDTPQVARARAALVKQKSGRIKRKAG